MEIKIYGTAKGIDYDAPCLLLQVWYWQIDGAEKIMAENQMILRCFWDPEQVKVSACVGDSVEIVGNVYKNFLVSAVIHVLPDTDEIVNLSAFVEKWLISE